MKKNILVLFLFVVSMVLYITNRELGNDVIRLCAASIGLIGTYFMEDNKTRKICAILWCVNLLGSIALCFA